MPLASQLDHRFFSNPALPYDVRGNPISREPVYIGGQNVLTSDREFAAFASARFLYHFALAELA